MNPHDWPQIQEIRYNYLYCFFSAASQANRLETHHYHYSLILAVVQMILNLTPAENCLQLQSCLRKQFGMAASSGTTISFWNWIQILSNVAGNVLVYVEPFVDLSIKITTLTSSIKFKNEKQIADFGLLVRTFNLELELGRNCTNHYHVLFFLCLYLCVYSTSTVVVLLKLKPLIYIYYKL